MAFKVGDYLVHVYKGGHMRRVIAIDDFGITIDKFDGNRGVITKPRFYRLATQAEIDADLQLESEQRPPALQTISARIQPALYARLQAEAEHKGVTMSVYIGSILGCWAKLGDSAWLPKGMDAGGN